MHVLKRGDAGGALERRLRRGDQLVVATLDRPFLKVADCARTLDGWARRGVTLHVADWVGA